jgi:hypothetical protein
MVTIPQALAPLAVLEGCVEVSPRSVLPGPSPVAPLRVRPAKVVRSTLRRYLHQSVGFQPRIIGPRPATGPTTVPVGKSAVTSCQRVATRNPRVVLPVDRVRTATWEVLEGSCVTRTAQYVPAVPAKWRRRICPYTNATSAASQKFPCSSGAAPMDKDPQCMKYGGTSQIYGGVCPSPRLAKPDGSPLPPPRPQSRPHGSRFALACCPRRTI